METNFKERRNMAGITLREIRDATGINISLLSRYENGKINPGLRNMQKIDEYLKKKES